MRNNKPIGERRTGATAGRHAQGARMAPHALKKHAARARTVFHGRLRLPEAGGNPNLYILKHAGLVLAPLPLLIEFVEPFLLLG